MALQSDTARGIFDQSQADSLSEADLDHWWFASKATVVRAAIDNHGRGTGLTLDLGCGAGGVTAKLSQGGHGTIGAEGSADLAQQCRTRHGLPVAVSAVTEVGLADEIASVVTLLDVLEHLPRPELALTEARRLLRVDGLLVVTVPAHQWLWSAADDALGHLRRYQRRLLSAELRAAGFEVVQCTHVFSWLVPPVLVRRRIARSAEKAMGLDVGGAGLSRVARLLTAAELRVTRRRSLPIGTSVLAVARPGRSQTGVRRTQGSVA